MRRLVIYGTGGFGREVLFPCRSLVGDSNSNKSHSFSSLVFCDDAKESSTVLGIRVISPDELRESDLFVLAVGSGKARQDLQTRARSKGALPYTLVANSALIGPDVKVGEGGLICDFSMITSSATIGSQFQCNIYSYVAHDCVIGDYVTFAPRVCCNGNVIIEDHAYIGTGAVLKQGSPDRPLRIGKGAVVGMGAVVTKDVPAGAVVVGNPARSLEREK